MLNILVVEDSYREMEYCCSLIKRCLPESNILKAGDQKDTFKILQKIEIDIFFIDVDLPDGNGFNIAERIRKNEKHLMTPIVFVTAVRTNQMMIHRKYHFYEFIEKPYNWETFSCLIKPVLEKLDEGRAIGIQNTKPERILLLESADQLIYVKKSSVLYVHAQMRKLTLMTKEGEINNINVTLKSFLKDKNWSFLKQSHKSFALNLENVVAVTPYAEKSWLAYFSQDRYSSCPIGITYYNSIVDDFKSIHRQVTEQ